MEIPGYSGLKRLARGGYATVYRGTDTATGRTVAIKVLDRIGSKEERRFSREFQTLDHLTGHPNVLEVHGLTRNDEGAPCLVLEYMPGGSLVDLLDEYPHGIDESDAAYLADNVLAALEAAHEAGVLHRDIKPSNVLLGNGHVKLADFGIAKFTDSTATTSTAISTTVLFAAPEVIMDRGVTEQSDLYSLGATIFSLLSGRPPHSSVAEALATAAASTNVDASLPGVTDGFAAWVSELLSADPASRPASAAEARRALQAFVPDGPSGPLARTIALGPIESAPSIDPPTALQTTRLRPPPEEPDPAGLKPLPLAWIAGGAAAVAAIVVLVVLFSGGGEEPADLPSSPALPAAAATTSGVPSSSTVIPGRPELVVVPDLSSVMDPESALSALGLQAVVTVVPDDLVPEGEFISQAPAAGAEIEPGTSVDVVISGGPEVVVVPDVLGEPDPAAALRAAGFEVVESTEYSTDVASGAVIGTRPPSGTETAPGTDVELIFSLGPSVVISVVDDSGLQVGLGNDIAIAADGAPIISYLGDGDLRFADCVDLLCTSARTSVIDDSDLTGMLGSASTALAVGGDGLPIIVYDDKSEVEVWTAHCEDAECTSVTRGFLETQAAGPVDAVTAPSGRVLFTYNKLPTGFQLSESGIELGDAETDVTVAACTNADCTGATRHVVRTYGWFGADEVFIVGTYLNPIAIIGNGLPQVLLNMVLDSNEQVLRVADCTVADCSSSVLIDPQLGTPVGGVAFTVGGDGLGLLSYADSDSDELYVVHCDDPDCLGTTVTRVTSPSGGHSAPPSLTIGADGLGVVAFVDQARDALVVAHCGNVRCTELTARTIDIGDDSPGAVSIVAAPSGSLFISYYDAANSRLKIVACLEPDCS